MSLVVKNMVGWLENIDLGEEEILEKDTTFSCIGNTQLCTFRDE